MKARVRKIKDRTVVRTQGYADIFVMTDMIGKTITVRPYRNDDGKLCPGWWVHGKNDGYTYHSSWLVFPKAKKGKQNVSL
jgi:hypothetical protein